MDDQAAPPQPPSLDLPPAAEGGESAWWRWPLATAVVAVPIIAFAGGVRLGCDSATLNAALCGARYAAEAAAPAEVEVDANQATISLAVDGAAPVVVAQEPSRDFAGQFAKFVVVAPDGRQAIYVTAPDLSMSGARLWLVDAGQPKRLLKQFADELWVARPVWCQQGPGDPGAIAYVARGPVSSDLTGLELWTIGADGRGDRRVLTGSPGNGFRPDLFYGDQRAPLRFLAGCTRIEYRDATGATRVVDLASGQIMAPVSVPGLPAAATPSPVAEAPVSGAPGQPSLVPGKPGVPAPGKPAGSGAVVQPCLLQPLAQTDPRWASQVMRTAGTTIGAEGCALTSTAMVFNYFGVGTDPGALNACAGNQANGLQWDPVRARCSGDKVRATIWRDHATVRDLEAALVGGRPAIVGFDRPANSHFLIVTAGSGDQLENYHILDSWDGSTYKTLADFISPKKGYLLRWLVVFDGPPPDCTPVLAQGPGLMLAAGGGSVAPVTFSSPANGGVYAKPVEVRYQVPPNAAIAASHNDGVAIDEDGAHTVTVRADGVPYRVSFTIDRTPPNVSAGWNRLGPTRGELAIDATDAVTFVTEAQYQIDDGPWQPFGPVTSDQAGVAFRPAVIDPLPAAAKLIRYLAKDSAGNESAVGAIDLVTGATTSANPTPTPTSKVAPTGTATATATASPGPTATAEPTAVPTVTQTPVPTVTATPTKKSDDDESDKTKTPDAAGVAVVRTPTAPPTPTVLPTPTVTGTATGTPTTTTTIVLTPTPVPPTGTPEPPATAGTPDAPEAPATPATPDKPDAPKRESSPNKPDPPKKDKPPDDPNKPKR